MCQPAVRRGAEALYGRFKLTEWIKRHVTYVVLQHTLPLHLVRESAET
ncbi:hypothetical protein CBM2586_B10715 [Cupriavidus phytorum]|uniref:Uncharacterized protein n=1 Tax=Cupriavidus taiwanensis TaxID=164546 RepID=A0A375CA53_9BURK|nr:hypothetical protein CBM2586_B10715 [Cupriavidus taiwanensis]